VIGEEVYWFLFHASINLRDDYGLIEYRSTTCRELTWITNIFLVSVIQDIQELMVTHPMM
jgi:hypothetical protein